MRTDRDKLFHELNMAFYAVELELRKQPELTQKEYVQLITISDIIFYIQSAQTKRDIEYELDRGEKKMNDLLNKK